METAQEIRDFVRNGKPLPDHFDMKHAYAAAKAYAGMTLAEFDAYVKAYAAQPANGFSGMTYGESFYKPMLEVFDYLKGPPPRVRQRASTTRWAVRRASCAPTNSSSRT